MITLTTYRWVPDFAQPLMRAFRVRWALEEAGLPYEVRYVELGSPQRSDEHLKRQPFGQAPAIEVDGLTLFESGAIALHIAEKSEALLPRDSLGRARAIAWLIAALNSVETGIQQLAEIDLFHAKETWTKERRPQVQEFVKDRLSMLARSLGEKDYLEGRFTVGDLMMADVLRILRHTDLVVQYPRLKAYRERCEARPAFQRALKAQLEGFERRRERDCLQKSEAEAGAHGPFFAPETKGE
jgi:glutathione S-transferase